VVVGAQGAYYVLTGLWPLVSLASFEAVTGPKTDDWLVHMVGLLAIAIGLTLGIAVARGETGTATLLSLAVTAALAFAGVDLWYGLGGGISPIYLADAVIELGWIALLGMTRGLTAGTRR
jgi:hypothetical protein